jgi:tellurite resistance protein
MTPSEKKVVKSLVAVAWADGKVAQPERHVIEGLLAGFDASDDEEKEVLEYARQRRTLADVPVSDLNEEERELLLANAALLTHADGDQSDGEKDLLDKLIGLLGFSKEDAGKILESVRDGAITLGSRALEPLED